MWDAATTEIPPEVGEAPECQWCPICRAARRIRESGPGIGGQLSGAGDAVASAVQDAISAFDTVLAKAAGTADRDRPDRDRPDHKRPERREPEGTHPAGQAVSRPGPGAGAGMSHAADRTVPPMAVTPAPVVMPGADSPETAGMAGGSAPQARRGAAAGSAETAVPGIPATEPDAWSLVTDGADAETDSADPNLAARGSLDDGYVEDDGA